MRLGFVDERCDQLAGKILACQWPDGGWNCDKRPEASHAWDASGLLCSTAEVQGSVYRGPGEDGRAMTAAR